MSGCCYAPIVREAQEVHAYTAELFHNAVSQTSFIKHESTLFNPYTVPMLTSEACTTDRSLPGISTWHWSMRAAALKLGNKYWHLSAGELTSVIFIYCNLPASPSFCRQHFCTSLALTVLKRSQHNPSAVLPPCSRLGLAIPDLRTSSTPSFPLS